MASHHCPDKNRPETINKHLWSFLGQAKECKTGVANEVKANVCAGILCCFQQQTQTSELAWSKPHQSKNAAVGLRSFTSLALASKAAEQTVFSATQKIQRMASARTEQKRAIAKPQHRSTTFRIFGFSFRARHTAPAALETLHKQLLPTQIQEAHFLRVCLSSTTATFSSRSPDHGLFFLNSTNQSDPSTCVAKHKPKRPPSQTKPTPPRQSDPHHKPI